MRDTPTKTSQRLAVVLATLFLAAAPSPGAADAARVQARAAHAPAVRHHPPALDAAERVHALLAERMPDLDPAARLSLGRTILEESALARVDPLLVMALIHVESSYRPHVVSPAGAIGLMQLREPTLRRELERAGLAAADPRDPEVSVRAGVRYLRRLIDAFGPIDTALMAYNAGPNRILGHLRAGGIPERFHEYPRRVRAELARLTGGKAPRSLLVASAER